MKINIVVLDYSCNTVFFHKNVELPEPSVGKDESEIIEDYLTEKEYHLSNCSWMSNSNPIAIIGLENDEVKTIEVTEPYSRSISWSVDDFKQQAINDYGAEDEEEENDWKLMFDESKFPEALDKMIEEHDAERGICWADVSYYLNEFCLVEEEENE